MIVGRLTEDDQVVADVHHAGAGVDDERVEGQLKQDEAVGLEGILLEGPASPLEDAGC